MIRRQMNECRKFALAASMVLALSSNFAIATPPQTAGIETFWAKFKAAVIKRDTPSIVAMTQFPVAMPYGQASIKTGAQLLKRYRQVFNSEANAAKCFADARPETDPARPKEFTIACDNGSGQKVVIYGFVLTKTGWKFKSLDNINE